MVSRYFSNIFIIICDLRQEIKANPNNYDAWFDYLEIVEGEGNVEIIRDVYERAIANIPPEKVSIPFSLPFPTVFSTLIWGCR